MAAFLPARSEVTEDYWGYARWRAGHRLFSSMLQNFATQARPCSAQSGVCGHAMVAGPLQNLSPEPSTAKQGPLQRSRCCWQWAWARSARCRPPRQSTGS